MRERETKTERKEADTQREGETQKDREKEMKRGRGKEAHRLREWKGILYKVAEEIVRNRQKGKEQPTRCRKTEW